MTSPLSGTTLTNQRANGRHKQYFLAISHPNTVFTALINQTFPSLDNVGSLTYDGGSGTYTNVLPGMTCWIGSAAGLSDIGIVRVRRALTSTVAYIGLTSDIAFADNLYLTFVDDFPPFAKIPVVSDSTTLIDVDMEFFPTSAFGPIVRVGPPAIVLEMTGASVTHTASITASFQQGATLVSYLATAPGASSTSGLTTATPAITYNAAGEYYESYTVSDSAGASTTVTRKVFVNPASIPVSVSAIDGDVDRGDFQFTIEGYSGVDISTVKERALCVLWRKDYAGAARVTSYGPYPDAVNVRAVGWLDVETLSINPDFGTASFTVRGPASWLEKLIGSPLSLNSAVTSTSWNDIAGLTVDLALYRLIHWQTTIDAITDIALTGDTTPIRFASVNSDNIFAQIGNLAKERLLARLVFDEYGCGFVTVPPSLRTSAQKAANTILWDIAKNDWGDQVDIQRITSGPSSQVELSGMVWDGTNEAQGFSHAPGSTLSRFGRVDSTSSALALTTQSALNQLAGDYFAMLNTEYPSTQLTLTWANDFAGFAMAQGWLARMSISTSDTPRGIVWADKRLAIDSVSFRFDQTGGQEETRLELSEETTGAAGVTYFPPAPEDNSTTFTPPTTPGWSFPYPSSTWFPGTTPTTTIPVDGCPSDTPANSFFATFTPSTLTGSDPVLSAYAYFPCTLRPASYTSGPTVVKFNADLFGDIQHYTVLGANLTAYAIDAAQNRILTGVVSFPIFAEPMGYLEITLTFSPVSPLAVAGFEIALAAGGTDPVVGGASTITMVPSTSSTIVNTGSVTINSFVDSQIDADLVLTEMQATFVIDNSLLQNEITILTHHTQGAGNIYVLVYFTTAYPFEWQIPGNTGWGFYSIYNSPALLSGGTTFKIRNTLGSIGTLNMFVRLYYSMGGALIPQTRRIVAHTALVLNVCA